MSLYWLDSFVAEAAARGVKPVLRIYDPPGWAWAGSIYPWPVMPGYLADFVQELVRRYGRRVAGYVIWNEPNLSSEWRDKSPDPAAYVDLLRTVYQAAKAQNPYVTIVSAGLAPTQGGTGTMSDTAFLSGMYAAGLEDVCDVVGMSGMGFGSAPDDTSDPNGYNFSRLAALREVMVANGDAGKRAWALEVGWLADTPTDLGPFNPWKVTEAKQAQYLRRAMEKAAAEWPWLDALFIWNLDFRPDFSTRWQPEKPYFAVLGRRAYGCISLVSPRPCAYPLSAFVPFLRR